MKQSPIYSKLALSFAITFLLVCVLFIILLKIESNTFSEEESSKHKNFIKNMLNYDLKTNIKNYLNSNDFIVVSNLNLAQHIREHAKVLSKNSNRVCNFSSLKYNSNLYLDIKCKNLNGLYENNASDKTYNILLICFFFFSFLMASMYFSVLKSLEPLKKLKAQVAQLGLGKMSDFKDYKNDEIGNIAFEFQKLCVKNQELIQSRQLFLRTIMHELKTPIGKGRIITEMLEEQKHKERLNDIFLRMNTLINEFAKIENLFSKNYNLSFKPTAFSAILKEAKKNLLRSDFDKLVKVDIKCDALLNVDMEIFPFVLNNLIDNALKYSLNGTCELVCYDRHFAIKNSGYELNEPIAYYQKAFTRDKSSKNDGLGLGLYIVFEVCKLHNFVVEYTYYKEEHCFEVIFHAS